ncbi:MAG: tetratricopeptide repeat protein [Acidobacteria bacterium]|nr:MAG: tetratricopeptide repeat protein [Acidobacteriota bacterium]
MNPIDSPLGAGSVRRRLSFAPVLLLAAVGAALGVGIDTLKIRGTVLGPDGEGMARTEVTLVPTTENFEPDPALTKMTIRTNRKGRFTLPFVKPGRYLLEVAADDLVPHHVKIQMRNADRRVPVLPDGTRLEDVDTDIDPANPQIQLAIPADVIDVRLEVTLGERPQAVAASGPQLDLGESTEEARAAFDKIQAGQLDEALADLDALLAEQPDNAGLHEMRGFVFLRKGDTVTAEQEFRRAVDLDPEVPGGWGLLASALADNGKFEEAIPAIREQLARTEDPAERARFQLLLGQVLLELDRADEAIGPLEEALSIRSDDITTKVQLVDAYTRAGREEDAERLIADLSDQTAASLHFNLAANYLRQKRWEDGIEHMRAAVELDPSLAVAWRWIGEAEAALGRLGPAIEAYEKYLAAAPDAEDADIVRQIVAAYRQALESK